MLPRRKATDDELMDFPTGLAVSLLMFERVEGAHGEVASFMQRPARPLLIAGDTGGSTGSTEDPNDHIRPPWALPRLEVPSAFDDRASDQLEQIFRQGGHEEGAFCAVFYVSETRQPHCPFPRHVWVDRSRRSWKRQVLQAWIDVIDIHQPVHVFVVDPQPDASVRQQHVQAHLIVAQHVPTSMTPVHITIRDLQAASGVAILLPVPANKRDHSCCCDDEEMLLL